MAEIKVSMDKMSISAEAGENAEFLFRMQNETGRRMRITRHAGKRLKERCGLDRISGRRMAKKAFDEGIRHSRTKGRLNKWVTKLYFRNEKADNIRLYGDKAFIFCGSTLVTVIQIPADLMRDFKKMIKERWE